jgi:hypothetical protein
MQMQGIRLLQNTRMLFRFRTVLAKHTPEGMMPATSGARRKHYPLSIDVR